MIKRSIFGVVISVLAGLSYAAAGTDTGNGLDFQKMLEAELNDRDTLSRQDLEKVVVDVGREFKYDILLPVYDYFLSLNLNSERFQEFQYIADVQRIQNLFKSKAKSVRFDIEFSTIRIHHELCTGEPGESAKPYDPINIDIETITRNQIGMTASQFVGAVMHEFVHHHIDPFPNHDRYAFSRFIEMIIRTSNFRSKLTIYGLSDVLRKVNYKGKEIWALLSVDKIDAEDFGWDDDVKRHRAIRFCQLHKHNRPLETSYKATNLTEQGVVAYRDLNGGDLATYVYYIVPNSLQNGVPLSVRVRAMEPKAAKLWTFYRQIECLDKF